MVYFIGQTAVDVCHTKHMKELLDVTPLRELQRIVQRYESRLLKVRRCHTVVVVDYPLPYFC